MNNIKRYLYNCYCGPSRLRDDQKDKHPGFIYENCPRISAPLVDTPKISEINDIRIKKFYNNLDQYISIFIENNVTRADFIGSFVRGQHSYSSDIDIEIYSGPETEKDVRQLEQKINLIENLNFDLVPNSQSFLMPHMQIPKKDRIVLFSLDENYKYSEDKDKIWIV